MVALLVTLGVLACGGGFPRWESPCAGEYPYWFGTPVGREFHMAFDSRLDVGFEETAQLVLTLRNTRPYRQSISMGYIPTTSFLVTTPDCELVWHYPLSQLLPVVQMHFEPREVKRRATGWSLIDDWGEMVTPGEYLVHARMSVDAVYVLGDCYSDWDPTLNINLVKFRRGRVDEQQLRAARPEYPPVPAEPCDSEASSVDMAHIDQLIDKHQSILQTNVSSEVLGAHLLDENRLSTGALGIRIVIERLPEEFWPRDLPKCFEGVPVQVVVRPDS